LSASRQIACASCHVPERAFSSEKEVPEGNAGLRGSRNAPSLLNVQWQLRLFWDGRSASLEAQALMPLLNRAEHGLTGTQELVSIVQENVQYPADFETVFHDDPPFVSAEHVAAALACFER